MNIKSMIFSIVMIGAFANVTAVSKGRKKYYGVDLGRPAATVLGGFVGAGIGLYEGAVNGSRVIILINAITCTSARTVGGAVLGGAAGTIIGGVAGAGLALLTGVVPVYNPFYTKAGFKIIKNKCHYCGRINCHHCN